MIIDQSVCDKGTPCSRNLSNHPAGENLATLWKRKGGNEIGRAEKPIADLEALQ